MLASGHAGQGKHQWDVSIAGVQRIAFVSFHHIFWIIDVATDSPMLARKYPRDRLPARHVRRKIHASHTDSTYLYGPPEKLHLLGSACAHCSKFSRLFLNFYRFHLCMLAERENLEPAHSRPVHIDKRVYHCYISDQPNLRRYDPAPTYFCYYRSSNLSDEEGWCRCYICDGCIVSS